MIGKITTITLIALIGSGTIVLILFAVNPAEKRIEIITQHIQKLTAMINKMLKRC